MQVSGRCLASFRAPLLLVAAMILFMPSALFRRFGLAGSLAAGDPDSPLILAHRRCWASFIRRRAAAENFLRLCAGVSAGSAGPPESMAWSSPIRESMCRFCSSKPRMAAVIISVVSFVGMSAFRINHLTAILPVSENRRDSIFGCKLLVKGCEP
jgi:hypothetical protein